MNESTVKKSFGNMLWRFGERFLAQIVGFVVSIILARILDPTDYGAIALITVVTSILNVFIDSGLGAALVQKKDADELDFSTVFYFNVLMCVVLYALLFFLAPFIARFYKMDSLTNPLRVLGLTLLISGVKGIQNSFVAKKLIFKKFFWATLSGTLIAAVVGIIMAYEGFGVWALVAQQLTNTAIDTVVLWFTVKWRPQKLFSKERLKILFSYGWKLLVSSLINTAYLDLRQLVIGKKYSKEDLAYYNRGETIPKLVVGTINLSIDSVLLPIMSEIQDRRDEVKNATRRAIKSSGFLMWPMMLGLASIAEPLILLLLGEKWHASVLFVKICCICYAFEPIQTANLNAIKALGRSDLFLKLEIIKKTVAIAIVLVAMQFGVTAIALSGIFYTIFASIMNSSPNKKLLNYSYIEQIKDILPYILLSIAMYVLLKFINPAGWPSIILVLTKVFVGVVFYFLFAYVFKFEAFMYFVELIMKMLKGKKK